MGMNIGFIGTGVIASALVTGLCSYNDLGHRIYLSPRNAERAAVLADKFENVTVCGSNQEVLDRAEWIVIALVPKFGEEILRPLSFSENHRVVNLMSDRKLPEIASWIGQTRTLVHMVPLPFAAKRIGPIAIYLNNKDVVDLFAPIGEIVAVDDVKRIEALAAITGLTSSYYTLLLEIVKWGEREGLSRKEAAFLNYVQYYLGWNDLHVGPKMFKQLSLFMYTMQVSINQRKGLLGEAIDSVSVMGCCLLIYKDGRIFM